MQILQFPALKGQTVRRSDGDGVVVVVVVVVFG